jgi:hypothetical protein
MELTNKEILQVVKNQVAHHHNTEWSVIVGFDRVNEHLEEVVEEYFKVMTKDKYVTIEEAKTLNHKACFSYLGGMSVVGSIRLDKTFNGFLKLLKDK